MRRWSECGWNYAVIKAVVIVLRLRGITPVGGKPAEKVRGRERTGRRVSGEARAEKGRGRERTCRRRVSDVMYCNVK